MLWQARAPQPLLPLRIVADRNRAGAYLAMLIAGAGMFGILLFANYYMQQNLGYSPVITGLAFLPMVAMLMVVTNLANVVLMPRTGPRPLVAAGMLLGGAAAALLTRLGVHSSYAAGLLPSILLLGAGLGFIFAPVADTGTSGVPPRDTGVASATVNTGNQLGGSIGTSLLNTIFAGAITAYIAANAHGRPGPHLLTLAAVHGYTVAFWWTAAIFAAGAIICGALMRSGPLPRPAQSPQPGAVAWDVAKHHRTAKLTGRNSPFSGGRAGQRDHQRARGRQHPRRARPGADPDRPGNRYPCRHGPAWRHHRPGRGLAGQRRHQRHPVRRIWPERGLHGDGRDLGGGAPVLPGHPVHRGPEPLAQAVTRSGGQPYGRRHRSHRAGAAVRRGGAAGCWGCGCG